MGSRFRDWSYGMKQLAFAALLVAGTHCTTSPPPASPAIAPPAAAKPAAVLPQPNPRRLPKVIVFVWDGLRPDSVTVQDTPNLARLRDQEGVNFTDHHSVYPTFTMMNAAALATGAYPAGHGFYGNTQYQPGPSCTNADGKVVDFAQPVFTEDHAVLGALDAFYRGKGERGLFSTGTLFEAAHRAGLRTAAIGKIGPTFLQDARPDDALSAVLDENVALPFGFARALQGAGFGLPVNVLHHSYAAGQALTLEPNNGKPSATQGDRQVRLADGATPDPRATTGSAHNAANAYLMRVYLEHVLPKNDPDLTLIWLRNPDSTEHFFGPGSANYLDALRDQDALLGKLLAKLSELGLGASTDLLVVSDHGHSTVAGEARLFPLRALAGEADGHGTVGALDPRGYPVSGDVRTADLLTRAGLSHVYDGGGCVFDPVLSGVRKDGSLLYPTRDDTRWTCSERPSVSPTGKPLPPAAKYSMPSFKVPIPTPKDAIVIAANGGSEYFYVLDRAPARVQALVSALQERSVYGAVFVHSVYGALPGTLPLSAIFAEGERGSPPTPDVIVSFAWDDNAIAGNNAAVPGTEYASAQRYRGMHGSFSPRDVQNTLIAKGPHFQTKFSDTLPSGNVDVAPTVAALLGLKFEVPHRRVLSEAFNAPSPVMHAELVTQTAPALRLRRTCNADDPACARPGAAANYAMTLSKKVLSVPGSNRTYTYLDRAVVTR